MDGNSDLTGAARRRVCEFLHHPRTTPEPPPLPPCSCLKATISAGEIPPWDSETRAGHLRTMVTAPTQRPRETAMDMFRGEAHCVDLHILFSTKIISSLHAITVIPPLSINSSTFAETPSNTPADSDFSLLSLNRELHHDRPNNRFGRHLGRLLHDSILEPHRRPKDQKLTRDTWSTYIRQPVAAGKPPRKSSSEVGKAVRARLPSSNGQQGKNSNMFNSPLQKTLEETDMISEDCLRQLIRLCEAAVDHQPIRADLTAHSAHIPHGRLQLSGLHHWHIAVG